MTTGGGQVATWTVLFTDMVGSTEFRVRVGEVEFDRVRADLDRRVASAITAHAGVAVKSTGDGVLAGFEATASALGCAAAIQEAVAERNREAPDELALRIAISVGDAVAEDGDLHGTAVVEAARLCAVAEPGTILCSEAVRSVSANRSGCTFGEPRSMTLKGLPAPVVVHEVIPAPPAGRNLARGVSFRVLGPLRVERDGATVAVGGPKEQLVLAVLLASAGTSVSLGSIVHSVWGDRPPRTAERTTHAYVARLRRALEPRAGSHGSAAVIETVGRGYRLNVDPDHIDAARFERLARAGADLLAGGDPAAAATTLRDALGEWRGDAYAGLPDVGPCAAEATRLEGLRVGAVEDRVDADLAAGEAASLVPELEAAVGEQPFRERRWAQLMLALYRAGRQREALDAYQRARRLLTDELGIEPGPDLRRLEAAVLAQDPALDMVRPAVASVPAALPGALLEVGPAFVGRETELDWLRDAWADAVAGRGGFVSVLGPEGIGKTRLAAELARDVHADGAAVLYGRCDHAHRGARALLAQALHSAGTSLAQVVEPADESVDLAEAVARFLPAWSRSRPVLVVLDDLQLADAETLEVVADLAGWCRATPMLVIGAFRNDPGPATRSDDTPGGAASQLALGPMSSDAVAQICDLYATEPWSAPDLDRICELTGGVPLLVHEQASEWVRERASRRMAEAGGRLAATRLRLVASRGEIAEGVEGIQRLLEQRRAQLAGREAQLDATTITALGACPYKGLARFEQADAANFFGRERLVAELIARLAESSFLAIVGPSGSGKSSLVRAGLLPALTAGLVPGGDRCHATVLCPGRHPGRELDNAVRDGPSAGERWVVFVDQFEETFRAAADHQEQGAFIGRLTELADRRDTAVVLAIRADQLGHAAAFPALADRLAGSDVLVGPMRDGELRRTVVLPAQRAGLDIEPGLVEVVVADVAGRAGALPLLSTALAETWERREARTLTLAGYRAAGGVNGAVARMAEDAYAALPPGPRAAARRLMIRLCDAGDDGDLSLRRRLPVGEAAHESDADAHTALEALADRRLLALDRDAVEIAHEALLREWPRLRNWLDEDVQGRRLRRRLGDAARSWEAAAHDPSELYRGTRLVAADEWATNHDSDLTPAERGFLDASRGARDAERRREVVRVRRLRALLAAVAVALLVSLAAGAVAAGQRDRASDRGRLAEARELAAAANANLDVDPERSVLLALEAVERSRTGDGPGGSALPEAEEALHSAVTRSRTVLRVAGLGGPVDWSPQGDTFVTKGPEQSGEIDIRDATTGESVRRFPGHDPDVNEVAYSPDGELLLTTGDDGAARLWDPATGEQVHAIERGEPAWGPSFSADGRLFAAAWPGEGVARVADVATGRVVREISAVTEPAATSLSPDGARVAVGSWRFTTPAKVIEVATGAEVFELTRLGGIGDVAWSPDGASIAGSGGGGAAVWDAATGRRQVTLHGHTADVADLDWSPDSRVLATASFDGTARVWILLDGGPLQAMSLTAQDIRSGVVGVAFSPDGTHLLTGDARVTNARVWDLAVTAGAEIATLPAPAYAPGAAAFMGDGQLVAAASAGSTVTLWDTARQHAVRTLGGELPADAANPRRLLVGLRSGPSVLQVAADPAGESVAALQEVPGSTMGGEVVAWEAATGQELFRRSFEAGVIRIAWSPDGNRLAVSDRIGPGDRGHVTVFDRAGDVVGEVWESVDIGIGNIAFTADGERIVGFRFPDGVDDEELAINTWDWRTGQVVDRLATPDARGAVWLSDDGALAASGLDGQRIAILDVARGRDRAVLTGQTGDTWAVEFSADGATVAVGASDGSVRLWSTHDGGELVTLRGHIGGVDGLDFSRDGSQLVSAGSDGTVRVWALRLDDLEDIARDRLTRDLTTDECRRYLHRDPCPSE